VRSIRLRRGLISCGAIVAGVGVGAPAVLAQDQIAHISKLIVNGREVPFVEDLGTTDASVLLYDNISNMDATNTFTGVVPAGTEDVKFAISGPVEVQGLRLKFKTEAGIPAGDTFYLGLQFWDGFRTDGAPSTPVLKGSLIIAFASSGAGWTPNTTYSTGFRTSSFFPFSFGVEASNLGVSEFALADTNGVPDTIVYPFVKPVFRIGPPNAGSTLEEFWLGPPNPGPVILAPGGAGPAIAISGAACYANCDGSASLPYFSAADFTCFLQKFRASDPYANCDGSTGSPLLTAGDFTCFLQKFQAGGCQ